ncbi:hypothetical protein CMI47_22650 [Candidatus Pacearchaeota archaeon]|jgi:hypothetical protein|nr:hypothetical protein [Candidatus Pacearchaeota archaeon]|tara:strand:+ start:439 stop:1878 length:1440 start_codon:yes stop_codon:yes gene_type:complete
MAYHKEEKKKSLPTLLGGLTSFGSVANLIKNLKSENEFYELEVGEVLDILLTYEDLKEKKPVLSTASISGQETEFKDIGMAKIRLIKSQNGLEEDMCNWYYPLESNIRQYPLKGEYVVCVNYLGMQFYTQTLNFISHINTNSVPGLSDVIDKPDPGIFSTMYSFIDSGEEPPREEKEDTFSLGEFFTRNRLIRQLKPYEGDITIQGRFGNTIRLGSNISDDEDLGTTGLPEDTFGPSPSIKMRAGQLTDYYSQEAGMKGDDNSSKIGTFEEKFFELGHGLDSYVVEDINADATSIYLTTNETVPLNPVTAVHKARIHHAHLEYPPTFDGKQIILNSDKIVFNTKQGGLYSYTNLSTYFATNTAFVVDAEAGISLNSPGLIGMHTEGQVHIRGEKNIIIDTGDSKLYLGTSPKDDQKGELEPVVKGDALVDALKELTDIIMGLLYPGTPGVLADPSKLLKFKQDLEDNGFGFLSVRNKTQ